MSSSNKIDLVIVVNGTETKVTANVNAPLQVVAEHALNQTEHKGRPLSDWELKDEHGASLDRSKKVADFKFASDTVLYLTLGVGVNGAGVASGCGVRG